MNQSETPHALKHRILELEEEVISLHKKIAKLTSTQPDGPVVKIPKKTKHHLMLFEDMQQLPVFNQRDSAIDGYGVNVDRRNGGNLAGVSLWLGNARFTNGRIPRVVLDDHGEFVLIMQRPLSEDTVDAPTYSVNDKVTKVPTYETI